MMGIKRRKACLPENCDFTDFNAYKAVIRSKGRLYCRVVSGSMEPLIRTGEVISVEKITDLSSLKRFDVLVFLNGRKLFCHYLWHRNRLDAGKVIVTRSLIEPLGEDLPVPIDHILGKVVDRRIAFLTRLRIIMLNLLHRRA